MMKLSIVHKISLSSVLLMVVSASVVAGLFYLKGKEVLVEHALEDLSRDVQEAGELLQVAINNQRNDVLFLTNTPPVQAMLRTRSGQVSDKPNDSSYVQWVERLETIFESQLKRKSAYLQIRFIDDQGQELVNVFREGPELTRARGKQLQNKAQRPYVKDTLKLPAESVYVSAINLNREFGKVVEPHQEVLRTATPVYDERSGDVAGLIIVTVEIGQNLQSIQKNVRDKSDGEIYITNDHGGYLLHPDIGKAYGFDMGKRYRIQEDFPYLAKLFLPENKDKKLTLLPDDTDGQDVVNFTKIPFDLNHPERFIAVIMTLDYASIVKSESHVLNEVMSWAVLMVMVGAGLGIAFSLRLTRPIKQMTQAMEDFAQQRPTRASLPVGQDDEVGVLARSFESMTRQVDEAQSDLREINDNLEKLVAERTHLLGNSEAQQRTILETIADAIITIDENSLISSFNPAAENIFGYRADEIIGQNVSVLLPKDERQLHEGYTKNSSLNAPRVINQARDLNGRRKDGSIFPLELHVAPMEFGGRHSFVGTLRDITERKRMDKMKNEFVSTVSHELRTPLTSIRGALGLVVGGAVGEFSEKARSVLQIAGNNTERLLLLINDILDIQKIESGEMSFDFQQMELMPFIEKAVRDNKAYGEQHNVTFKITQRLEQGSVFADPDRLMQVMSNLLSNAAKFSPVDSTVEIRVARQDNGFQISIVDHGSGIPVEFQPKLFDKFTQADSTDTRKIGGTGLGLSIAKMMVEKHGGKIDFISKPGEGATFFVDLPELNEAMAGAVKY